MFINYIFLYIFLVKAKSKLFVFSSITKQLIE